MKIKRLESPFEAFDLQFPEKREFDVVGLGLNSVDHLCVVSEYPRLDSKTEILKYERLPGGQVATALIFLSRMGLKAKYIGKFGGDELGRISLRAIKQDFIDLDSALVEQDARNQYSIIIIDKRSGERTILCQRDLKLDFKDTELCEEAVCSGRILHLDGYDSASLKAADWCQKQGIPVCADLDRAVPNCPELIRKIDFLIVSSNFSSEFTGIADPVTSFRALRQDFDGFLAMTLGAGGALAWIGNKCVTFPGITINAVDTTGAGDIFHGAFIYGLLQNWALAKIMCFANAAAGLSCLYLGAQTGIRPLSEIQQSASRLMI
jgi:sulfofructose kinase